MSFSHNQSQNDYGQTQTGSGVQQKNGMAIAALVLGILAALTFLTIFGGILLGLPAVILGIIAARKARGGRAPHGVMAIIGAVLGALGIIGSIVIIAIGASFLNSTEVKSFEECAKKAKTQSERTACEKDFDRDMNN
ncbi:DUF4190 domain-containing protein [Streptomyces sp. NPDC058657]|uniref:DUF4190 domain-containing protein n=1 Tax=unclassified Streptomyces TaxID=2593676 RepID=UPI003667C882